MIAVTDWVSAAAALEYAQLMLTSPVDEDDMERARIAVRATLAWVRKDNS
jgi:hypothetical protein